MAKTRVVKWGKGLAVRIPKAVAARVGLKEGDSIVIEALERHVKLRPAETILTLEELVERITPENCHEEIKWGSAVGKEVGW
jgi:antitoxin MazE